MTKEIYEAIEKRVLEALPTTYCDLFLGQYHDETGNPLWSTPAVLIEFAPVNWDPFPDGQQRAILEFTLHLVSETAYDSSKRITATDHYANQEALHRFFNRWVCRLTYLGMTGDVVLMNTVVRTRTEQSNDMLSLIVTRQNFKTQITDFTASQQWALLSQPVALEVDAEIVEFLL